MRYLKKILCFVLCCVLPALSFGGCSLKRNEVSSAAPSAEPSSMSQEADRPYEIGLLQYAEHPAYDALRESFLSRLEEWGYDDSRLSIDYRNAEGDETKAQSICKEFVDGGVGIIVAISTPAAEAAASAAKGSQTKVLFAGWKTDGKEGSAAPEAENVTGIKDETPAGGTVDLALQTNPGLKTLGLLYDKADKTSQQAAEAVKAYCTEKGLEVTETPVENAEGAEKAAKDLCGKADALFTPTGKIVKEAAPKLAQAAREAGVLWYGDSSILVQSGALAAVGPDYEEMGRAGADMAVSLMAGKSVAQVPCQAWTSALVCVNQAALDSLHAAIPEDVLAEAYFYGDLAPQAP